jgi:hypothetical protein
MRAIREERVKGAEGNTAPSVFIRDPEPAKRSDAKILQERVIYGEGITLEERATWLDGIILFERIDKIHARKWTKTGQSDPEIAEHVSP